MVGKAEDSLENNKLVNKSDASALLHEYFKGLSLDDTGLDELIKNPLMLDISTDVMLYLKRHEGGGYSKVSSYTVYSLLMKKWFETKGVVLRRSENLPEGFIPERSGEDYAMAVAAVMFKKGVQTITGPGVNYRRAETVDPEVLRFFGGDSADFSRKVGPFQEVGDMSYSFIHKSIGEFLVAKAMLEDIRGVVSNHSLINMGYIQKSPAILRFMLDEITQDDLDALEAIIHLTRDDTKAGIVCDLATAAANAATLYVRHSQLVASRDWSDTQIMGANISGARFYDMNFTGSYWSNVTAQNLSMRDSSCHNLELSGFDLGEQPVYLIGHDHKVNHTYINEVYAFSGYKDKTIKIWDIATGECVKTLVGHTDEVTSVYANELQVFSGSKDFTVRVWDIATGECINVLAGHKRAVNSVHANESHVFSGSDDRAVIMWGLREGISVKVFEGHKSIVTNVYESNGQLISASRDCTVRVWNANTGDCVKEFKKQDCLTSLHVKNNNVFIGNYEPAVTIWDMEQNTSSQLQQKHEHIISMIYTNSHYLFTGSVDTTIKVWDLASGEYLQSLRAHSSYIAGLYATETNLISVEASGKIIIWDIKNIQDIKLLRSIGERNSEQALDLVGNKADNIYGLSNDGQELFKQRGFTPIFEVGRALAINSASIELGAEDDVMAVRSSSLSAGIGLQGYSSDHRNPEEDSIEPSELTQNATVSNNSNAFFPPGGGGGGPVESLDNKSMLGGCLSKS